MAEAARANDPGGARVDAIKTGLGIGAGTTGIFALLLAVRRQWHSESDATEKNVTELYTKAADQLGSVEAPVRLAGLYALERLAHNNPDQRQSIVNVICAYLRMPYKPPDPVSATDDVEPHERIEEREVRLAGQRILSSHLAPQNSQKFWDDIDLDLTNAGLIGFSLKNCRSREGRFDGATFNGDTSFGGATFNGDTSFGGATFNGDTSFGGATFNDDASFGSATFNGDASFSGATFARNASFSFAALTNSASFSGTVFIHNVWFRSATFTGDAWFRSATFADDASFDRTAFTDGVSFDDAIFAGDASFDHANFTRDASFDDATFAGDASFTRATVGRSASFSDATFACAPPAIDRRLAEKTLFDHAILVDRSPDQMNVAGVYVNARGVQAPEEVDTMAIPARQTRI